MALSNQQRAVLEALNVEHPRSVPTVILEDVQAQSGNSSYYWKIGEPVGAVLRRLEHRGLVRGAKYAGLRYKEWTITETGREAIR